MDRRGNVQCRKVSLAALTGEIPAHLCGLFAVQAATISPENNRTGLYGEKVVEGRQYG